MIVGVIQKASLAEVAALLRQVDTRLYDMVELRLDGCRDVSAEGVAALPKPVPLLLTVRSAAEGGAFAGSEDERFTLLCALMATRPAYMDVEAFLPAERIAALRAISPETQIVLSWHDFSGTPADLEAVLTAMRGKAEGVQYKLAALARNTPDALRMLVFCRQWRQHVRLTGISMGEYGATTRILAPVAHGGFCYCPLEESTAPGQLDAHTLRTVYRYGELNADTAVYGLLGDPVEQSVGHVYHNGENAKAGINAVYVKWRVRQEELAEAMPLLSALNVRGLSVTMPLKQAVIPLLKAMDDAGMGAVNTLTAVEGGFLGLNTDGQGALNALEQDAPVQGAAKQDVSVQGAAKQARSVQGVSVQGGLKEDVRGKRIAILGAGGAARAVMVEAVRRGARLTVFNRTPNRPLPVQTVIRPFAELPALREEGYHILLNALPFDIDFPFEQVPFLPGALAMDLSYGKASDFTRRAAAAGCRLVDGYRMFLRQAERQREIWGQC